MLYRLNAAINRAGGLLIAHATDLDACNGPVPRDLADKLVCAIEEIVWIARTEPRPVNAGDEPTLPITARKAS